MDIYKVPHHHKRLIHKTCGNLRLGFALPERKDEGSRTSPLKNKNPAPFEYRIQIQNTAVFT
jgi:hypothetical protein